MRYGTCCKEDEYPKRVYSALKPRIQPPSVPFFLIIFYPPSPHSFVLHVSVISRALLYCRLLLSYHVFSTNLHTLIFLSVRSRIKYDSTAIMTPTSQESSLYQVQGTISITQACTGVREFCLVPSSSPRWFYSKPPI